LPNEDIEIFEGIEGIGMPTVGIEADIDGIGKPIVGIDEDIVDIEGIESNFKPNEDGIEGNGKPFEGIEEHIEGIGKPAVKASTDQLAAEPLHAVIYQMQADLSSFRLEVTQAVASLHAVLGTAGELDGLWRAPAMGDSWRVVGASVCVLSGPGDASDSDEVPNDACSSTSVTAKVNDSIVLHGTSLVALFCGGTAYEGRLRGDRIVWDDGDIWERGVPQALVSGFVCPL
jgi:hypothetical protein